MHDNGVFETTSSRVAALTDGCFIRDSVDRVVARVLTCTQRTVGSVQMHSAVVPRVGRAQLGQARLMAMPGRRDTSFPLKRSGQRQGPLGLVVPTLWSVLAGVQVTPDGRLVAAGLKRQQTADR